MSDNLPAVATEMDGERAPFFTEKRRNLFRPLAGKFREMAVGCLKVLYLRLHGPNADYSALITKDELKSLFLPVISATPVLGTEGLGLGDDESLDIDNRTAWMIRELETSGWLDYAPDKAAMASVYRLTRVGKALTEVITGVGERGLRSRQRNVRNTRNALQAYARDRDPYNLIDALTYAALVSSDLSDEISDLHERKAELVRDAVSHAGMAIDQFREYMERRFIPDHSVRLSADSVERHRHSIYEAAQEIRAWPSDWLHQSNRQLQGIAPDYSAHIGEGLMEGILTQILGHIATARAVKMPELRAALSGFIKRSSIIIAHASMVSDHAAGSINRFAGLFAEQDVPCQDRLLRAIGRLIEPLRPRLIDPVDMRLRQRKTTRKIPEVSILPVPTREERLGAAIQNALESAFVVSAQQVREEILRQMGDSPSMYLHNFQMRDALSLLMMSQSVEVGALGKLNTNPRLVIEPVLNGLTPQDFETTYGHYEEFIIRKVFDS